MNEADGGVTPCDGGTIVVTSSFIETRFASPNDGDDGVLETGIVNPVIKL